MRTEFLYPTCPAVYRHAKPLTPPTHMTNKEWLLKIAKEVEDNPSRWTKNCLARNKDGMSTPDLENAVCWCAYGFMQRDNRINYPVARVLCNDLSSRIPEINDDLKSPIEFVAWFHSAAALITY
jgi:hypothetical protein